MILLFKETS